MSNGLFRKLSWFGRVAVLLALAIAPSRVLAQTQPLFQTAATTPQAIPSSFQDGVLIRAVIKGRPLWFALDTGAAGMVMDRRVAQDLSLTVNDGSVIADVDIGAYHAHNAQFDVTSLNKGGIALPTAGIIGVPFLSSAVLQVDFLHQRIVAYPNGTFSNDPTNMVSAPISVIDERIYVHAWFGKKRAAMLLDTGADRTHLFSRFSNQVSLVSTGDAWQDEIGLNAPVDVAMPTQAQSIAIGGLYIRHVAILEVPRDGIFSRDVYADGILGRDILSFFSVALDYNHSMVYFSH